MLKSEWEPYPQWHTWYFTSPSLFSFLILTFWILLGKGFLQSKASEENAKSGPTQKRSWRNNKIATLLTHLDAWSHQPPCLNQDHAFHLDLRDLHQAGYHQSNYSLKQLTILIPCLSPNKSSIRNMMLCLYQMYPKR